MQVKGKNKTTVERVAELAMRLGGRISGRLRVGAEPGRFHAVAAMACLILRGVFEYHLSWRVGVAGGQPELAGGIGDAGTNCRTTTPRSRSLARAVRFCYCRCDDPDDRPGGGRGKVCQASPRWMRRDWRRRPPAHISESCGTDTAQMGESVHDCAVREFAAAEPGLLGAGQRQVPGQGVDDQGQSGDAAGEVVADAGYDAEWVHDQCRLDWGAESVIKPARQRADGTRSGCWRSRMSERYLERKGYGTRWAVESFFSGLKRTMGSTLTSRKPNQLLAEAAFKVLAYTLRR